MNVTDYVLEACARFPEKTAITDGELTWSYSEFAAQILDWADHFSQPEAPSRIGFILPNSAPYLAAMYGAIAADKTPFLLDDALNQSEIQAIVDDVKMDALLVAGDRTWPYATMDEKDGLFHLNTRTSGVIRPLDSQTAICRFTSGTSGTPKCLEFSHQAVTSAARVWVQSNDLCPDDTILCLSGFFNGLAFNTSLTACFLSGATLAVYRGWASPGQVMRYARSEGATRLIGFPAFYQLLASSNLSATAIPNSLKRLYSAASRLSDDTRERLWDAYKLTIINYYGIAEAGPVTTETQEGTLHGSGHALDECDIRVRNGKLEVRTPYMATRYLNGPDELECRLTPDGYLLTSDKAHIDDGRLFLTGRVSSALDVGGKKFPASDVTNAIMGLPGVTDAFVFGDEIPDRGTRLCAAISVKTPQDEQGIRAQLAESIARYKIPQSIRILDTMPRNAAGKINAVHIRKMFSQGDQDHV